MTRRLIAIVVAIVLAAVGTAGILWYVTSVDKRTQSAISDPVTVAVAKDRIPAGTSGAAIREQGLVVFQQMPKGVVPLDDVLSAIGPELDTLVLTAPVERGYLVTRPMFGETSQVTSGLPLASGRMAVTVQTSAPGQVAGYVREGAFVAIFTTYKLVDEQGDETNRTRTKVLLPKVQVLAVGENTGGGNGNGSEATNSTGTPSSDEASLLITVAVTQTEAERLILALNTGSLYLGLLTESIDVKAGPGVENIDSGSTTPLFR
jgi:pilus assembly protein CpaB